MRPAAETRPTIGVESIWRGAEMEGQGRWEDSKVTRPKG